MVPFAGVVGIAFFIVGKMIYGPHVGVLGGFIATTLAMVSFVEARRDSDGRGATDG